MPGGSCLLDAGYCPGYIYHALTSSETGPCSDHALTMPWLQSEECPERFGMYSCKYEAEEVVLIIARADDVVPIVAYERYCLECTNGYSCTMCTVLHTYTMLFTLPL